VNGDGDHDRLYNPDGWGCGPAAALVVAVMALLLVLPGVLLVIA
jgi:hypothetical protein